MESQGNGWFGLKGHCRSGRCLSTFLLWALSSFALWAGMLHAQQTGYVYDANRRVVAVTANNGTSVQYSYNALGHASQISAPLSPDQLAIFAFTPTHGEGDTQVTIQGQGFDTNAANDTVSFNGTIATVLSATATQLVTSVPDGATTGPISVTVGSQNASSATPFVIDDTGLQPAITQVSPLIVAAGGMVTITGTHLDPVPGDTAVQTGGMDVPPLSSVSDTQLQYAAITSGYVTVETPYGEATSASPVITLPSGVTTSSVVSSSYATSGGVPVTLNVGGAGQVGAILFDANTGEWLSLQATGIASTASNIDYKIYAPGDVLIQQGTVSAASPSIHLPKLSVSGTYLATFQPDTSGAQLSIAVEADPRLVSGASLAIATGTASRSERLWYTANAGDNLELLINQVQISNNNDGIQANLYTEGGTYVEGFTCYPTNPGGDCRMAMWNLAAGTYQVIVTPPGGTMSFNALIQPDVVGPSLTPNTPTTINLGVGQMERLTFTANAGDTVALQLSGVSTTPAGQTMWVNVYSPTTGTLTVTNEYAQFSTTGSTVENLPNLPASGTYTVTIFTTGIPGSGQLTLVSGTTGALSSNGTPQYYSTSVAGQDAYLTFTASAGANLELTLDNLSVSAGSGVMVSVYNAGNYVGSFDCYTSNPGATGRMALWNLAAGTYSVIVSPLSSGTMSFNALIQPDVVGPSLTPNTPTTVNLGVGQMERLTFTANAGDTVALQLSGVSTTPADQTMWVNVYSPTTGTLTVTNEYAQFSTTGSTVENLPNLPASGTYTVTVFTTGIPGSGQLTLVSGTTGALSSNGTPQHYSTSVAGQDAYLTFTASAGANLELTLDNLSVSAGSGVMVSVYNAGNYVGSFDCYTSNPGATGRMALWNLAAGTYSVIVSPLSSGTMSFNALIQPDVVGPSLTPNTPTTINLGVGQMERLTFTANAGDTVALQLSGVSTTPTGQTIWVNVYSPTTGTLTVTNEYAQFSTTSSTVENLPNLPASGTYTVIVFTTGIPANAQITLVSQ